MAADERTGSADATRGRRRWQFTLKSLAVFVTLCCVVLALLSPYWQQRRMRDRIQREMYGTVEMRPHGPGWARRVLGDRWFEKIDSVELDATSWMAADLDVLRESPYVTRVTLWAPQRPEPAALVELTRLPNLATLELRGWPLAHADFLAIEQLTGLRALTIADKTAGTDDAALSHIAKLSALEALHLEGMFTDAGLAHVAALTGLRELTLVGNATDAGMVHLMTLTKLEKLTCMQTAAQLTTAEGLAEPTELDFTNCPLKRAVLDYLKDRNVVVITVDAAGMAEAGFDPENDPVTIHMPSGTLRDGLNKVLHPVGLDWTLDTLGIKVSGRAAIERGQPGLIELRNTLPRLKESTVDW